MYHLVVTEKPSVAQSIAAVIGARQRKDGYLEGNGYLVSWCIGHLVELADPTAISKNGGRRIYPYCRTSGSIRFRTAQGSSLRYCAASCSVLM